MYNILVVGAGYLGTEIAKDFKARKQRVYAMTRNSEKAEAFEKMEIIPVLANLSRPETLLKIPAAHFIVISVAPDEKDEAAYRKIYVEGVRNFLEAIRKNPPPSLIVLISSTSVWKERGGEWVDETTPADGDTEKARILLESEKLVLKSGHPSVVFRLSGIYGPRRNRIQAVKAGKIPLGENAYMNMIHVRDAAGAILPIFKNSKPGEIYTGTDEEPVTRTVFYDWLSEKLQVLGRGESKPFPVGGKRLKNQKLKSLGFEFKYPTFREGYTEMIKQENA